MRGKTSRPVYYDGEPVQPEHGRTPEHIPEHVLAKLLALEARLISKDHSPDSVIRLSERKDS